MAAAQVTSHGYSSAIPEGNDTIYIFCNGNGNLNATLPGSAMEMDFEWSVWDPAAGNYGEPFKTERGFTSVAGGLESGGYRVRITGDDGTDTTFRAWIFINAVAVSFEVVRHDCQVLDLSGRVEREIFRYYDPGTGEAKQLPGEYHFSWSADPFIPVSSARLDTRIWDPPPVTTRYMLSAVYHTCQAEYVHEEEPVTTRAEFTVSPSEGEAPLEITADAGMSLNADQYQWFFDYQPGVNAPVQPDATGGVAPYIYYIPGEYRLALRTINGPCDDVFVLAEPVRVWPSELSVPNVFTPTGDGHNDIFSARAISMREFHAAVYNRDGRKIHEWTDPAGGWDGLIGGRPASTGVYFYQVRGTGWDDRQYELEGPFYLFR